MKIDRSFICDIGSKRAGARIIPALIGIAERMGIDVVAEGVETVGQERYLLSEGCHLLQGFRFFRPMTPEQIAEQVGAGGAVSETCGR